MSLISEKLPLRLVLLFPAMILLGSMLAIFADSPFLIILLIGALTLTSFAALDYALYILVASLPFSFRFFIVSGTEMQVPTEPLLAIMSIALVLRWIIIGRKDVNIKFPFRFPMLLYGISLCLSMINAGYLFSAMKSSLRALAYMMLSVIVFNVITDRHRVKQLFVASIIPATIAVGWTVIFLADRLSLWRWSSAYEGLLFSSYMHYGSFVAVILLILLSRMMFDRSRYDRVMWAILLIFYGIAILFCFSRGVWVSFILAIGFMLLQRSEGLLNKKILTVVCIVAVFAILLSIPHISNLIISRASTILTFEYGTNKERLLRWGTAIMMFLNHPVLGNGYGSFAFTYVNDPSRIGSLAQYKMGAHSEYLQTLAETGLLGFLAWMWIIVSFFLYGFRLLKKLGQALEKSRDEVPRVEGAESKEQGTRGKGHGVKKPSYPVLHASSSLSFWRALVIGIMSAELSLLIHFLVNNLVQVYVVGVPFWLLIGLLPAVGNVVEKEIKGLED